MARFRITPNELHAKQGRCLDVDQAVDAARMHKDGRLAAWRGREIRMEEECNDGPISLGFRFGGRSDTS